MQESLPKNILKNHSVKPNKLLGQNFLTDKSALKKIIEAAKLSPNDNVLEVGPGTGILTKELAQKSKKVVAVEKDPKMVKILNDLLMHCNVKNIKIVQGDILKLISNLQIPISNYKVVANIPYYLTSNLIRKLLESKNPPQEMILTIQKEVAERICSKPPGMSLLAVSVQFYAKAEIVGYISKKCFWPVPKVDSAIIKIRPLINIDKNLIDVNLFFKIVKAGFSQPRKQLLNNLKSLKLEKEQIKSWLLKNKIEQIRRAETLEIKDWINLCKTF